MPGPPIWRPTMREAQMLAGVLYLRAGNLDAAESGVPAPDRARPAATAATSRRAIAAATMLGDVLAAREERDERWPPIEAAQREVKALAGART